MRKRVLGQVAAALSMCLLVASCTTTSGSESSLGPTASPRGIMPAQPGATGDDSGPIVVGRGRSPLSRLMARVYATALADNGVDVALSVPAENGDLFAALRSGGVDVAPQLLGPLVLTLDRAAPGLMDQLRDSRDTASALKAVRTSARSLGMDVLNPAAAEARPEILVKNSFARDNGVRSVSDLAAWSQRHLLRLGGPPSCQTLDWCASMLAAAAGVNTAEFVPLTYAGASVADALRRGDIDAGIVVSVDPAVEEPGVMVLSHAPTTGEFGAIVPTVASGSLSDRGRAVVDRVSAALTGTDLMRALSETTLLGRDEGDVAAALLQSMGIGDGRSIDDVPVVGVTLPGTDVVARPRASSGGPLVIASSPSMASTIVAHLYGEALAAAGVSVTYYAQPVNPQGVPRALAAGTVDVVPVLLGNNADWLNAVVNGPMALPFSTPDGSTTRRKANDAAKTLGYTLLEPAPAVQASTFAVTEEFSRRTGVTTLSDLVDYSRTHPLRLAVPPDCDDQFFCRPLLTAYGVQVGGIVAADTGGPLTRAAIVHGSVDAGWLSNVDPTVDGLGLVGLVDDRRLQPAWNVTPAVSLSQASPVVTRVLNALSADLTTDDVRGMLKQVESERQPLDTVVRAYLRDRGVTP